MLEPSSQVDINRASTEALIALPGIGPALAQRIVADRPYASVDDLARVRGISPEMVERLRSMLTVSAVETEPKGMGEPSPSEPESPVKGEEGITRSVEGVTDAVPDAEVPLPVEEPVRPVQGVETPLPVEDFPLPSPAPEPTSHAEEPAAPAPSVQSAPAPASPRSGERIASLTTLLGVGAICVILAVGLTLGILSVINGGLRYATTDQAAALSRNVESLESRTAALEQEANDLRKTVQTLEGLSGRMTTLEDKADQLTADAQTAADTLDQLKTDTADLNESVLTLQNRTLKFETFLTELQKILGNLSTPTGGTQP